MNKISKVFKISFSRGLLLCEMLDLASPKDKEGTEKYAVVAYQSFIIVFFCRNKSFELYMFF